jgi:hypothetical protein
VVRKKKLKLGLGRAASGTRAGPSAAGVSPHRFSRCAPIGEQPDREPVAVPCPQAPLRSRALVVRSSCCLLSDVALALALLDC